mgnify:FL=1
MNRKVNITIGRQFQSGGSEIGKLLAESLDLNYYDKKIVDGTAAGYNLSTAAVEEHEEKPVNPLWYIPGGSSYQYVSDPELIYPIGMRVAQAQFDFIEEEAKKGGCVFVGRCSNYVLRKDPNAFHVFIKADEKIRIKKAMNHYGIAENEAKKLIRKADKNRAAYYRYYTEWEWKDMQHYDLIIDSGKISSADAVKVIEAYMDAFFKGQNI